MQICEMDHCNRVCFHCTHVFDLNDLKNEKRRNLKNEIKEVNAVKILSECYEIDEEQIRHVVELRVDDVFICNQCVITLKAVFTCETKLKNLLNNIKKSASPQFIEFANKFQTVVDQDEDEYPAISTIEKCPSTTEKCPTTTKKRALHAITPSKSGCTPRGKRNRFSTPSKGARRRQLKFQTPKPPQTPKSSQTPSSCRKLTETSNLQSPGPKVKVQIGFRSSQRNSLLQGPGKLACRAIVMKQYKTALNHLLQIDEVKRDLATTVKKTLDEEAQKLCRLKSSVFKVSNISKFTWRSAISQLENTCPITMDILSTIIGNNKKEKSLKTPRMVTSMGVLLFSRNRRMNTLQAINSVMMYRGHVRTRVYSTFNRAGISNSYKATLGLVDQICENFDMPVKKWSKEMSNQYQLNTVTEDSSLGDHCYSTIDNNVTSGDHCYSAALLVTDTPLKDKESYGDLSSIDANEVTIPTTECFDEYYYATPITKVSDGELSSVHPVYSPLSVGEIQLSDTPLKDNRYLSVHGDVPVSTTKHFDDTFDVWIPNITEEQTTSPDLSPRTPVVKCVTDAAIVMSRDESPFTTTQKEANRDGGSFQVVMDNLNLHQKTRHKTLDNKNKIHNLVHSIAVHSRVSGLDLDSTHPQADILSIPNDAFIPGDQEYFDLHQDFKTLMKRTLIENVPCLENLKHLVEYHIQHQYSKQSEKKSNIIPLGILEKDENIMEQMIEIMEHLQQYVPTTENGKMIPLLLGGDALSVERGDGAQRARQDARTPEQRLDGYVWKSEDWHGHIISLQESFNMLFKGSSSGERGTLFQLKNMLDRRGVKSEVTKAVNDCREFMRLTTQGFILLAALQVLGVDNLIEFDNHVNNLATDEQKAELMEHIVQTIVDRFIKTERFTLDCDETTEDNNQTNRVPCGYPGCPKSYLLDGLCRRNHRQTCQYKDLDILQPHEPVANEPKTKTKKKSTDYKSDYKFNYTCCVLRDGLMDWCREDSAKENDGDRLFRMWKFDMLRFSNSNHTKYRLLAFKLQAQIMATLPPRLAFELKHNRSINIHGGKGGNVPGDLALEFFNMRAKDALHALHGNLTSTSIKRVGRSLQGCNDIMDAYVNGLGHYFGKPSNSKPSLKKDINMIVKQLQPEKLFNEIPGRYHKSFQCIPFDPLSDLKGKTFNKWLTEKKETYAKIQRRKSYYV